MVAFGGTTKLARSRLMIPAAAHVFLASCPILIAGADNGVVDEEDGQTKSSVSKMYARVISLMTLSLHFCCERRPRPDLFRRGRHFLVTPGSARCEWSFHRSG